MDDLRLFIDKLNKGGILIYPTDTAYGIGCRIDKPESIDRLFRIRRRPAGQPMPVLVDSVEMALQYFHFPIPEKMKTLLIKYWPGALTAVYYCKKNMIYPKIRADGETVGLRTPDHHIPLTLIRAAGVPIIGTSANFHGAPTPYAISDIDRDLVSLVDGVIEGKCSAGQASTVLDCTINPWKILRQGAVVIE